MIYWAVFRFRVDAVTLMFKKVGDVIPVRFKPESSDFCCVDAPVLAVAMLLMRTKVQGLLARIPANTMPE